MDRKSRIVEQFEMLLLKQGHHPSRGYIDNSGAYQDLVFCSRCGYSRRMTEDERDIEPCLVEDRAEGERAA